jgi:hypothetical protein
MTARRIDWRRVDPAHALKRFNDPQVKALAAEYDRVMAAHGEAHIWHSVSRGEYRVTETNDAPGSLPPSYQGNKS